MGSADTLICNLHLPNVIRPTQKTRMVAPSQYIFSAVSATLQLVCRFYDTGAMFWYLPSSRVRLESSIWAAENCQTAAKFRNKQPKRSAEITSVVHSFAFLLSGRRGEADEARSWQRDVGRRWQSRKRHISHVTTITDFCTS